MKILGPRTVHQARAKALKSSYDEALKQTPGSKVTVDSLIDDSVVRELEKEGFIDKVYLARVVKRRCVLVSK